MEESGFTSHWDHPFGDEQQSSQSPDGNEYPDPDAFLGVPTWGRPLFSTIADSNGLAVSQDAKGESYSEALSLHDLATGGHRVAVLDRLACGDVGERFSNPRLFSRDDNSNDPALEPSDDDDPYASDSDR